VQALGDEVGSERGQRDAHPELDLCLGQPLEWFSERNPGSGDEHERDSDAEQGGLEMARSRAEREDDEADLEALKKYALEGEPPGGPVTPTCWVWQRCGGVARLDELVVGARAAASA